MKIILFSFLLSLTACAAKPVAPAKEPQQAEAPPKTPELAPKEEVQYYSFTKDPEELFKINSKTLKVTYSKGADPKKVVDKLVQTLIQTSQNLQSCQMQLSGMAGTKK